MTKKIIIVKKKKLSLKHKFLWSNKICFSFDFPLFIAKNFSSVIISKNPNDHFLWQFKKLDSDSSKSLTTKFFEKYKT
jgi:hypothetical protein